MKLSSISSRKLVSWFGQPQGQRWILWGFFAFLIISFFFYIQRPGDLRGYVLVGNLLLNGGDIYLDTPPGLNTWPPFFSLLCIPFALLAAPTPYLARGLWIISNFAFLLLVARIISQFVYNKEFSLRGEPHKLSIASPEVFIPLLLTYLYITSNFEHLQINILLFFLTLYGLCLQAKQHESLGGIAIGLAGSVKIMPFIFIPYFIYRRRYKAAIFSAAAGAFFSLSPILILGWNRFSEYVNSWQRAVKIGWGVGKMNQSVFAMWDRFIGHKVVPFVTEGVDGLPVSESQLVFLFWVASLVAISGLILLIFRNNISQVSMAALVEWSVVFIIAALFGPVSWKAYLVVLVLPNAILFKAWRSPQINMRTRRIAGAILLISFIIGGIDSKELIGKKLSGILEMASCITVSALVLLGGLLWFRFQLRKE